MIDIEALQSYAKQLLAEANDFASLEKAAGFIRTLDEIENERASTGKLLVEQRNLLADGDQKARRDWRELLTTITPLLTTFILAGTLVFQAYTFRKSEQDKVVEAERQAQLAEKTRWTDALKLISETEKLSPAEALLQSFTTSPYKELARKEMLKLLTQKTNDAVAFEQLFKSTFEPIEWSSLPEIVEINVHLKQQSDVLLTKAFDANENMFDGSKLSAAESSTLDNLETELTYTCSEFLPLLRSARKPNRQLDLSSVSFGNCDVSGANLSGADISSTNFSYNGIESADLSGITKFDGANFSWCAWWHASKISAPLFDYLKEKYPLVPNAKGWTKANVKVSTEDYERSLRRLMSQPPTPSPSPSRQ